MTLLYNRKKDEKKRRRLRNNMTEAEKVLWKKIRKRQVRGQKFRRQVSVCGYVLDFFCPSLMLAIEVDGGYHLSRGQELYDAERQEDLENLGIRFIRFTNDEVFSDINRVADKICEKIQHLK